MKVVALLTAAFLALTSPDTASAGMLTQAQQYAGLHEVKNNRRLRAALGINPARTPWCGHFMGMVARKSGRQPPKSYGIARSWLRFGAPVKLSYARPGDVVVVRPDGAITSASCRRCRNRPHVLSAGTSRAACNCLISAGPRWWR